ncbi:MAG: exodeoxyribonuclease VII large subunit [Gaiellaceae bacterium]
MKVAAEQYGDRKVYTVSAFNRGIAGWLARLPTVWVEGEVTELRRQQRWQSVFFTLKDPGDGACLSVSMPRGQFDALRLDLGNGERVHVYGRPELFEAKGDLRLRALSIERFGLGDHLAALERLKQTLSAEGLFATDRKRRLPRFPRAVGLLTGNDAAAKRDVLTAITTRFPSAHVIVAETYVQGPRAAPALVTALEDLCLAENVDVIVLARGGGSFEDLLPFSDERLVRAVASCPVPIVSAVGHEQDTPLTDLAADARASTPSVAARLVVPDADELRERLSQTQKQLQRAPLHLLERKRARLGGAYGRLRALSPRATLERGYAIVRDGGRIVRAGAEVTAGTRVDVELGQGGFGATIEETR